MAYHSKRYRALRAPADPVPLPDAVRQLKAFGTTKFNQTVEVSTNLGTPSYLIDTSDDVKPEWLNGVQTVALTAGASAPEVLVEQVMEFLQTKRFNNIREVEVMPENVRFGLPPEIVEAIAAAPAATAE